MQDQKTIELMLKFGADTKGADTAKQSVEKLAGEFSDLEKQAKAARAEIELKKSTGAEYSKLETQLKDVETQMKAVGAAARKALADEASQAADKFKRKLDGLRQTADSLEQIGSVSTGFGAGMFAAGAGVLGGAFAAAQNFVNKNPADSVAQQWAKSTQELESSFNRIGKTLAETMLPVLEKAATITDKLATFIEENPDAIQSILAGAAVLAGAGGGLMAVGSLLTTAGQVMKVASAVGQLFGPGGALGKLALGAIGGVGAAVAGGVAAGAGIYELAARQMGLTNLGQFASVAAYKLGELTDGIGLTTNAANDWFIATSKATNATGAQTQAAIENANAQNQAAQVILQAAQRARGYGNSMAPGDATRAMLYSQESKARIDQLYASGTTAFMGYQSANSAAQAAYDAARAKEASGLQSILLHAALDFAKGEAKIEADYYRQREKMARDFGEETLNAERDHQKEMRRAAEDHADDMSELGKQRDALGMVKAARAYEKERARKEDDYRDEQQQRDQAFAQTLRDNEDEFRREREQRTAEFQDRQAEARAQSDERLREMDDQYQTERNRRQTDFNNRLIDLGIYFGNEKQVRDTFYARSAIEFQAYLNSLRIPAPGYMSNTLPGDLQRALAGRAGGGYADAGVYRLGEAGREFVLNANTTRAAEALIGGRLTQSNVLSGATINLGGVSVAWNGSASDTAKQAAQLVERELIAALNRAKEQYARV